MWKRKSFGDVAEKSFTGTLTSPKLMEPLQIGRGIDRSFATELRMRRITGNGASGGTVPRARERPLDSEVAHLLRNVGRQLFGADLDLVLGGAWSRTAMFFAPAQ
jgi:hypothetical protein